MFTVKLEARDRAKLRAHLLALGGDDRRLRFGYDARDSAIERYVDEIDFAGDAVFGVEGEDGCLEGAAHLALHDEQAEVGVSVLEHARGRGIGSALVSRAAAHARVRGVKALFMQCLSENRAMMRIAHALGMRVVTFGNESEAALALTAANVLRMTREPDARNLALFDAAFMDAALRRREASHGTPAAEEHAAVKRKFGNAN